MTRQAHSTIIRLTAEDSLEEVLDKASRVRPSARQLSWQRDEISAFVHFGMNTFTGREWGDGTEEPRLFDPTEFDARQWARAVKAAGISRMILTAKHHDGFCLWPSRFTDHSVRNSPWRKGKGDVIREFVEACRAEGLRFGLYVSPWDRHEPSYGDTPQYNQYFLAQLRELLSEYPDVAEVWFDGACAEGRNGKRQEYDWRAYFMLIRELAPGACITVRGPDVRWCGNEAGRTRESEWSVIPLPGDDGPWEESDATLRGFLDDIHGEDLGSREVLLRRRNEQPILVWYPSQVNTSIRPGWFYHDSEDGRVRSVADLFRIYQGSVGGNGQFLLNIPPDRRGLFHENDVACLRQFGELLRAAYSCDLLASATVRAEVVAGVALGEPTHLLNPDPDTRFTVTAGTTQLSLVIELREPILANCIMLAEHIASGQHVEAFEVEARLDDRFVLVARGTVIGHKKLVRFVDQTLDGIRIRFTQFRSSPTLSRVGLYLVPAVLAPPRISRDAFGTVAIDVPDASRVHFTVDGQQPTELSPVYVAPFPMPEGGTLLARAYPRSAGNEVQGAETATTRVDYGPAQAGWQIVDFDSEEPEYGAARHAIDGDISTLWHTDPRERSGSTPHYITVGLGGVASIAGFVYTPRQDQSDGGIVLEARFAVSENGVDFVTAVDAVTFDNIVNSRQRQYVRLSAPIAASFFRMTVLRTANDDGLASAADVSILVCSSESVSEPNQ